MTPLPWWIRPRAGLAIADRVVETDQSSTSLLILSIAFAAVLGAARPAAATVVFSHDFEGDGPADFLKQATFLNWMVSDGTVDLIGVGGGYDLYPGNGVYVDLDGSTTDAGTLTTSLSFAPGSYVLTFLLGGNARGGASDTVFVSFGADNLTPGRNHAHALSPD